MALALDASTPAFAAASTKPWTTASFNPPNNSLLVAVVCADWFNGTPTITFTDSLGQLTFTSQKRQGAVNQGLCEIFTAEVGSNGGSRTISATTNLADQSGGVKVYVFTGYQTGTPIDTTGGGSSTTNNITPTVLTTGVDGCWVVGGGTDWNALGAPTSTDVNEAFSDANLSLIVVRKSALTSPAGAVTLNFDAAGTGAPQWTYAAVSVAPVATAGTDLNPVWFPGFMTGAAFPGFMLPAFQPINPAALPYDTGIVATGANPAADNAAGTGAANAPSPSVSPGSQASAATGTANNPQPIVAGSAGAATGTGTANATTSLVSPSPSAATATGTAQAPSPSIQVSPTTATATGAAYNPTIQTGSFTNAAAGVATATGVAQAPNPKVSASGTAASGTGTANNASAGSSVNATAGVAVGAGTANGATVAVAVNAQAGVATATGAAQAPRWSLAATAQAAVAIASAFDVLISGAEANAQSAAAVTAKRTSTATAAGNRAGAATVTGRASSTPEVTD